MSGKIILHHAAPSRSSTVLFMLEEVGVPYDLRVLDLQAGDQLKPAFLAINPMGKVPALKDGNAALGEAAAICAYIADRYPETGLAPAVTDPLRAKYLQWLFFSPSCIEPALIQLFTKLEVPASTAAWGSAAQTFDVLDAALQKGPWILGEKFSAADIMLGSGLNFAVRMFKMVPPRPSFDAYIDRCVARPAFQRAEKIAAG
mgnify:CR=1 FL=1